MSNTIHYLVEFADRTRLFHRSDASEAAIFAKRDDIIGRTYVVRMDNSREHLPRLSHWRQSFEAPMGLRKFSMQFGSKGVPFNWLSIKDSWQQNTKSSLGASALSIQLPEPPEPGVRYHGYYEPLGG